MLKYIHHIMFDPLSWWEKAKFDLVATACIVAMICAAFLFFVGSQEIKKSMRNQSGR